MSSNTLCNASGKFLSKFFEKLTYVDFKSDRVLAAFYIQYKKTVENDQEKNISPPGLFQFFTEYLMRNKEIIGSKKNEETMILYDKIKETIFSPVVDEESTADINPRISRNGDNTSNPVSNPVSSSLSNPVTNSVTSSLSNPVTNSVSSSVSNPVSKTTSLARIETNPIDPSKQVFKLNKRHVMGIISEFIKQSFIVTYENPENEITQEDADFHDNTTNAVTEEYLKEFGPLPQPKKDIEFGRRNDIIELWRSCENMCIKFIENDAKFANILKKSYLIDCNQLSPSGATQSIQTVTNKDLDEFIPQETLISNYTNTRYNTKVIVVFNDSLSEAMNRAKKKIKVLLVNSGSQMMPGGNSNQGIETQETPLYLSSSFYLCVNKLIDGYPLENNHVIYCPSVLIFKDHKQPKYPMLSPLDGQKISVLNSAPRINPQTNINKSEQSDTRNTKEKKFDQQLYLPGTMYCYADRTLEQLRGIFNAAQFFGHNVIILDERGVRDFLHPVFHLARLLSQVINENKGRFEEIVVSISDQYLYGVFKKHIW
jgi:hypothetical protein